METTVQTKRCPRCETVKDATEFNKNSKKKDGLSSYCRVCNSEYGSKWHKGHPERLDRLNELKVERQRAAKEFVKKYLQTHPCVDCDESDWVVLEFDHVRGVKHKSLSYMIGWGYKLSAIIDEIAKCDVRCANCHRKITYIRAGTWKVI